MSAGQGQSLFMDKVCVPGTSEGLAQTTHTVAQHSTGITFHKKASHPLGLRVPSRADSEGRSEQAEGGLGP